MTWLRRPEVWLSLSLLVVAGGGGQLLGQDAFVHLSERDRTAYGARPIWQARFDALSATCGVGLLTYSLKEDYTPAGRWVLMALGLAGALLYLAAARQVVGRLWANGGARLPSTWLVLAAFLVVQVLAVALVLIVERLSGAGKSLADEAWQAISAFSSLGWRRGKLGLDHCWVYALLALLGSVGWPVWLLIGRRVARVRGLLTAVCSYAAFLLVCAALIAALEVPRGAPHGRTSTDEWLADQGLGTRYARGLVQVVCASGAGMPTEALAERAVGDGTKFVLAGIVLVGGLGGSAGGGIKWPLLLWALAAAGTMFGRAPGRPRSKLAHRCVLAGIASVGAMVTLALVAALGLLLIEQRTGSAYQSAPTLADALLDASSAVAGAALSSGLTATVTNVNLSSGIRQNVDLYQYGMTWLMIAMFVGRILPVLVLGRFADLRFDDAPARLPPLI